MIITTRRRPDLPGRGRRAVSGAGPVTALLGVVVLAGCSQADQAARSAAESVARDAVSQATAAGDEAGASAAREQAQQALDATLDQMSGTCADVLDLPPGTRDEQAHALLRAFWLTELTAEEPSESTADSFADAVVDRCDDSRETDAATVLREVWDTGDHGP